MALAEKNGVDRERVMSILSSSIFDCLIYKVLFRVIMALHAVRVFDLFSKRFLSVACA